MPGLHPSSAAWHEGATAPWPEGATAPWPEGATARWFTAEKPRIAAALAAYVAIDTTSPNEPAATSFLTEYLGPLGFAVAEIPLPQAFFDHPERAPAPASKLGPDRRILRFLRPGRGGRHLIVNAHVDVVPLQAGFEDGFRPRIEEDRIVGRGTVDTKGNLVMFAEALRWLLDSGREIDHALTLDLVPEEEIGGNGALASALAGTSADCALVLEPTGREVFVGHRGCVSFEAVFRGRARHMGDDAEIPASVIDVAAEAVRELRALERAFDEAKAQAPGFEAWRRAVQVNVGHIRGGEWYGSIPAECRIAGNCGFLPSHGLARTQDALDALFRRAADGAPGIAVEVGWPALRNEAYWNAPDDRFFAALLRAAGQSDLRAWNVSCDGRHYARLMGLPTAIYGCGTLEQAHAVGEALSFGELAAGIETVAAMLAGDLGGTLGEPGP